MTGGLTAVVGAAFAAAVCLFVDVADAKAAPLMTVLIKPGPASASANTGDVDVVMTIPAFQAAAGRTLFSLSTNMPGAAYAQTVDHVTASDALGAVPLTARARDRAVNAETKGDLGWTSSRAVSGVLTVRYHLPLENIPMLSGGPPPPGRPGWS